MACLGNAQVQLCLHPALDYDTLSLLKPTQAVHAAATALTNAVVLVVDAQTPGTETYNTYHYLP